MPGPLPPHPLPYWRPLSAEERAAQGKRRPSEVACAALGYATLCAFPLLCCVGTAWPLLGVVGGVTLGSATLAAGFVARRGGDPTRPPSVWSDFALVVGTVGLVVTVICLLMLFVSVTPPRRGP